MPRKKAPELLFQEHIAEFLIREHGYGALEQADITDTEHCIAEDNFWTFLTRMKFSSGFSITNAMAAGSTKIEQQLGLVKSRDSSYPVFNTPATPLGRKADAQLGRVSFFPPQHFPAWQAAS